jgi:TM2 domain-containing membrane protein YozV
MSNQGSSGNVIAAFASLIVPGLGQLLQGRFWAGLLHFTFAIVLWFFCLLGPLVHVWSYLNAGLYYNGKE